MSGKVRVGQGVPLTLRHSKGGWNTFFNGLLNFGPSTVNTSAAAAENRSQTRRILGATAIATIAGTYGALLFSWGQFASGGALLLTSVLALCWPESIWRDETCPELTRRQRRLGLLAVCALAAFFRAYRAEPPGLWGDDAINGLLAFDVLDGKITSPFQLVTHSHSNFHALTNYVIAGAFWAFGAGPLTLRLPGIVANGLAVPLLYGIVAPLLGARTGLLAACFFASSPLQIGHCKGMTQAVFGQFFEMLGLFLIVRGGCGARPWLLAAAGVPLALSLYTYHSAKLVPLIGIAAMLVIWRVAAPRRPVGVYAAAAVAVLLLCSIPGVERYFRYPAALTGRVADTNIWSEIRATGTLWPLWDSVWRTLAIFHYQQGPKYHWFGIGSDPGFNIITAWLALHGLVQSARRWREPRHSLLLAWAGIGLIPGFLSSEAPRAYRVLLATPPFYVWAALPLVCLLGRAATLHGSARRWLRAVAIALVLVVPVVDFNYYFYRVYSSGVFRLFQAEPMVEMARTLRALGPGWTGYVLADTFGADYETFAFLSRAWGLRLRDVESLADVLPVRDDDQGTLFMISQGSLEASAAMRSLYPDVQLDVRHDPPARSWWFDEWLPLTGVPLPPATTVAFFPVSRQAAEAIQGLTATFFAADGTVMATRVDAEPRIRGERDLPHAASSPVRVVWSGAIYAPAEGTYAFEVDAGGDVTVRIGDVAVISGGQHSGAITLAQGLHSFQAEAALLAPARFGLHWKSARQPPQPIPSARFFRDHRVHGVLAEYTARDRVLRRIEPFPYYFFFPRAFADLYSARWRGLLDVPEPGGFRLEPEGSPLPQVRIDGAPWHTDQPLSAGSHDLEIAVAEVSGRWRLRLYWQRPGGARELIPPEAFTPAGDVR